MCPHCSSTDLEIDHKFCLSCRADLRDIMHKCASCGEMMHFQAFNEKPFNHCPICGGDSFLPPGA